MKFKQVVLFILISVFLGSCIPYKSVLKDETDNILIQNSIQSDYVIENIYNIKRKTTLELNLEKGKRYKFQLFSKRQILLEKNTYNMYLLDTKSDTLATNHNYHGDFSYFSRTIVFECKNTGKYNLKLSGKYFPNSSLLAVASQISKVDEEYVFVKRFYGSHPYSYDYNPQYTCVFHKGVTYKYNFKKGIAALRLYDSRKDLIMEYTPTTTEKEVEYTSKMTGIYFLKIINPQSHDDSLAITNLYFKLTDERKEKLKVVSMHQIEQEEITITKVFDENTSYFFRVKGCGETVKVEILWDEMVFSSDFEFKNEKERFLFNSQKTGIYHIKVTKLNPSDNNYETILIIEK